MGSEITKEQMMFHLSFIDKCRAQIPADFDDAWRLSGWLNELKPHIANRSFAGTYCNDVDLKSIGFKDGQPVNTALHECKTKRANGNYASMSRVQLLSGIDLANKAGIPFYLVHFNDTDLTWKVRNLITNELLGTLSDKEAAVWFRDLSNFIYHDKVWKPPQESDN